MLVNHRIYLVVAIRAPLAEYLQAMDIAATRVSDDWLRLSASTYFLWSRNDPLTITTAFRQSVKFDEIFVVTTVDDSVAIGGQAPQWCWDWLNHRRERPDANTPFLTGFDSAEANKLLK